MPMTRIYCEPAECYEGCDDPQCHYMHWTSWHREGDPSVYTTKAEAEAAKNPHPFIEAKICQ